MAISTSQSAAKIAGGQAHHRLYRLALASFLALYFELLVIRYVSTEFQVFGTLKNLPLIASFFGIGSGMLGAHRTLRRGFVFIGAALFLLARFRSYVPQPSLGWQYQVGHAGVSRVWLLAGYIGFVLLVLWLIVAFFSGLGAEIGESLQHTRPLQGYGVNLAGSLAGMLAFTLLSFLRTPPVVWLSVGFVLLIPLLRRTWIQLAVLVLVVVTTGITRHETYWSPYHRIDIQTVGSASPSSSVAYSLHYNHLWYQTMVDLSPEFMREHPAAEPNRSVRGYYELPYRLVSQVQDVLIVGAGTGNDVAAALRHGAQHVDAVEIDPVILDLGRRYHPEHPYQSRRVTAYVDDGRAFFRKSTKKYDLIVFGFLDSSTLLTSFSSIRLDNYIYTREGFEAARKLLKPEGSLVLAFAATRSFAANRLFATLTQAFDGVEPRALVTSASVLGMVYVEGAARDHLIPADIPEATAELHAGSQKAQVATDNWPFLYLETRSVPVSLQVALATFVITAWLWQRKSVRQRWNSRTAEFFLLGAGFLLLETNAVTHLALLFGSTWLVNAAVISAFLFMALAANAMAARIRISFPLCYAVLLLLVISGTVLPSLGWEASRFPHGAFLATVWTALPVFFSGLIFSSAFRRVASPSTALAMNLLGAVVGGVLENATMIGGTMAVGFLAVLVYAGAWVCSVARQQGGAANTERLGANI